MSVFGDFFGLCTWDHDYAVSISDDNIARLHQDATTYDRAVDGFDFVSARPDATADFPKIKRYFFSGDFIGIAGGGIGNNADIRAVASPLCCASR